MNKVNAKRQKLRRKKRQRKTLVVLISGGLLLFVAAIIIAQNVSVNSPDPSLIEVSGQPSLKVDQDLIDYGEVKLNTNLTFDLQLTNVGDQALKIADPPYVEVKDGC